MTREELRAARKSLGLTQAKFAEALGVSSSRVVRRWENGQRAISNALARHVEMLVDHVKLYPLPD